MTGTHTLYRMFSADDRLLYIGITMNIPQRFTVHRHAKSWWSEVTSIRLEHFSSRSDLETAEDAAIAAELPLYNVKRKTKSETARESARRLRRCNAQQREPFKRIRTFAHRGPDDAQLRNALRWAQDTSLPDDDVQWALTHPRCRFEP